MLFQLLPWLSTPLLAVLLPLLPLLPLLLLLLLLHSPGPACRMCAVQ
jgi:hypothetical protein